MYLKGPSTGELLGFLGACAVFFMVLGAGLAWLTPKVWAWIKPWLHAVTG